MIQWLRRNPRLLLMAASTLASNISGALAVLAPRVMLPDAAAELLSKCPQLCQRTPSGTQVGGRLWAQGVLVGQGARCMQRLGVAAFVLAPRVMLPVPSGTQVGGRALGKAVGKGAGGDAMLMHGGVWSLLVV